MTKKHRAGRPDLDRPDQDGPDIIELGAGQCKFPVTQDRPYKFCGAKTNGTYCPEHSQLAYDNAGKHAPGADDAVERLAPA